MHTPPRVVRLLLPACLMLALVAHVGAADAPVDPEAIKFFESKVRPVLVESCFKCHGEQKQSGSLRLDSRQGMLTGGDSGPVLKPGDPAASLLIKAVGWSDKELRMPRKQRLPKQQVEDLTAWVKMGAPWPGAASDKVSPPPPVGEQPITARDRQHWSFQPVRRPAVPVIKDATWGSEPIDAFILSHLEAKGLPPSASAGKRELLRRVYFDLIGLPPTAEEIEAFVKDESPDAYEKRVDELLARPQYGERWGRHWLDVVRFAQTNGYERDAEKPQAWRYRDYVIASFNADKPYDRFLREQIAGDEIDPDSNDALIATAFWRLGVWDDEPDDNRQAEFDNLDDMLATTSEAFLGLTLGCCRCHDHKFDPFPQKDYYSMLSFLRGIKKHDFRDKSNLTGLKGGGETLAVQETGKQPPQTQVLITGQAARPSKAVEPRFLRVLCRNDEEAVPKTITPTAKTSGRRRALAEWMAAPENPLPARVIVNRLWKGHFGRGLVSTPNNFGRNGLAPTHPELLDWLAAELVEGGWHIKRMQKMMVMSNTYRQSSRMREDGAALEPDNTLLWRQNFRRLEAESIRDAVLATSGRLQLKMGGRGIFPKLPREVLETQSRPGSGWDNNMPAAERDRRSVYIFVKRTLGVPLLESFDPDSPDKSIATRTTTTIAPQALILLNSEFMDEQSAAFADRLLQQSADPGQHVALAYRLALGRTPEERERRLAQDYLDRSRGEAKDGPAYRNALARLCKLMLNLNEFVYVD